MTARSPDADVAPGTPDEAVPRGEVPGDVEILHVCQVLHQSAGDTSAYAKGAGPREAADGFNEARGPEAAGIVVRWVSSRSAGP